MPDGVSVAEIEQKKRGDYRHRIMVKDNKVADDMIELLKQNQIMHAIHVVEGKNWYNHRIAPEGKSFTYMWILRFFTAIGICIGGFGLLKFLQNEDLRNTIMDTINELKGGM